VFDFLYAQPRAASPPAVALAPTPLLAFLAGEHAEAIARAWPAPHAEFFALTAARRHAAALALLHRPQDEARVRVLVETMPLRDLAAFAFQHPPRGLSRALSRLGETLLPEAQYVRLMAMLRDADAAQVLHHADVVDEALLGKLAALPPALRRARIVAMTPNTVAAQYLADGFAMARAVNPHRSERDLAMAFARAEDTQRLFALAIASLAPDRFAQQGPPPAMAWPYRAIVTREALHAEALRFRNCIASYVFDIGAGAMAVYVREFGEPAMIALKRDVGGWRLAEALAVDNIPLPEPELAAIVADFTAAGVRAGPPVRMIEDQLETFAVTPAQPAGVAIVIEPTLHQRLALGQLWR
jgi:hypothetical protein